MDKGDICAEECNPESTLELGAASNFGLTDELGGIGVRPCGHTVLMSVGYRPLWWFCREFEEHARTGVENVLCLAAHTTYHMNASGV